MWGVLASVGTVRAARLGHPTPSWGIHRLRLALTVISPVVASWDAM